MRSVSSAKNLRKIHAKRAEMEGGGRSMAPIGSNSQSEDDSDEPESAAGDADDHENTQERHQALMHRIFPSGTTEDDTQDRDDRSFSRQQVQILNAVKQEGSDEESQQQRPADSQMTDADMREMSEAQAAAETTARDEDVKMPTVEEEASREQGPESGSEPAAERSAS